MNYLVTGGAGFIGSHIAQTLLEQGHHVRVLDNFSTGKRENIEELSSDLTGTDSRSLKVTYATHPASGKLCAAWISFSTKQLLSPSHSPWTNLKTVLM